MATDTNWRSEVGFSDRLANVTALQVAQYLPYLIVYSGSFAQGHAEGTKLEAEAFNGASSKAGYQDACQKFLDEFKSQQAKDEGSKPSDAERTYDLDPRPGQQIGPYKKALPDNDGLFSTIYKSRNADGILVALKVTAPQMMEPPHDSVREARVIDRSKSTNVIPLLNTLHEPGRRFVLIFPYMRYQLDVSLSRNELSAQDIQSHMRDLFRALGHIHSLGIIHRDIKPSNILLRSPSGPAYLADFGIAWDPEDAASEPASEKITDVGTTCYRPPEVLFGAKDYDPSLDLWAAGCVVAEAINLPAHKTLFDAGELGSELALIHSIFTTLGTPNLESWPSAKRLPDWGKIEFKQYPSKPWGDILGQAPPNGQDLVQQLVRYESKDRITPCEALKHSFFS
ncbi:hypothetical protein FQN49_004759 [Arthroderma sp. PD_2]|nr:hypothetical protein FQN49_004759 [Arthroderma sp. PD_2]